MKLKTFTEWKADLVKQDSEKHGVSLYFRWTKDGYYKAYGHYVQKTRKEYEKELL